MTQGRRFAALLLLSTAPLFATGEQSGMIVEKDVAVVMRDGVALRADVYRPDTDRKLPVLLYRTPYGKHFAAEEYSTHSRAVARGYAVVLQDVRGRYASDGGFNPYFNEGNDGFDTIAWAAEQSWSNGSVGTFGLSYPGAVQWLAAIQSPPALKAMAPAMTFSSPRNFFYMNGVFDMSWLPWIYLNIAPDARTRLGIDGPVTDAAVAASWAADGERLLAHLPLNSLPDLRAEAPFYFEWLSHPPYDDWWSWAEIRGRYDRTDAAVLNISGWYDEAYGPEGAVTNHSGLVGARGDGRPRSHLIMGPWKHGVFATEQDRLGEVTFGPMARLDYDATLLRFFDHYLRGMDTGLESEPPVRYWLMGANEWRTSASFPPGEVTSGSLCLGENEMLGDCGSPVGAGYTTFVADPMNPVTDPFGTFEPHDYRELAARDDVVIFETAALDEAITMAGYASANMFVSCDCRDFDLWVRLLDVFPDGRAINLMSPGADVQRLSYRNETTRPELLTPGKIYEVRIDGLLTANQFRKGHRVRIQISASFAPHLSRNLQTGISEVESAASSTAEITIHHGEQHRSSIVLPLID